VLDANGNRVIFPLGVGMIGPAADPLQTLAPYPLTVATNGGNTGTYYLHTHDHSGMVHVEDAVDFDITNNFAPPNPYTIGTLMTLMSQTAGPSQFTQYVTGQIHVYTSQIYVVNPSGPTDATNEVQTAPVEWLGDINTIPLQPFEEITVETTAQYYPVPRYYFPSYWCTVNPSTLQPDCTRNAAPSNVQPASIYRKPAGFIEKPDPT
jgi:hypothetical protein